MNRYERLISKANKGNTILMDGAIGTESERRGIIQLNNAWNGGAALKNPRVLREIHEEYIKSGAEIIISNTFANSKHALEDANEEHNFLNFNEAGIRLAIQARESLNENDVLVAGSVSYWTWSGRKPSLKKLEESIEEQVTTMANSGADLIALEMMVDIEQMLVTLKAAKTSGLPIWVGLSCELNKSNNIDLLGGDSLEKAINVLQNKDIDVINIMHTNVAHTLPALKSLKEIWLGMIGAYAHSGSYKNSNSCEETYWAFEEVISPEKFYDYAKEWKNIGVNFIGGCCGINAEHIKYLKKNFKNIN